MKPKFPKNVMFSRNRNVEFSKKIAYLDTFMKRNILYNWPHPQMTIDRSNLILIRTQPRMESELEVFPKVWKNAANPNPEPDPRGFHLCWQIYVLIVSPRS